MALNPEQIAALVADWPEAAGLVFGPADLSDDVAISTTMTLDVDPDAGPGAPFAGAGIDLVGRIGVEG